MTPEIKLNGERLKILLFMPALNRDKQLELFLDSTNFDVEIIAIQSESAALKDYCNANHIKLHTFIHSKQIFNFIKGQILLKKVIHKFSPNLIESHSFLPGVYLGSFRILQYPFRAPKFRIVNFRHHNLNHHLKRNRLAIWLDRFIFMMHDHSVVPSSCTYSVLLAEGCDVEKLSVIPHRLNERIIDMTYEMELPKYSLSTNCFELIAVGRLDWQKNYNLMMKVLHLLKGETKDFHLRIFGTGSANSRQELLNLIDEYQLRDAISLEKWTQNIEVEILRSDVFLHTAIDESFGLVLAESLALGTPVVSNWMGGARDIAVLSGSPIARNSPEDLFRLLKLTLLDLDKITIETKSRRSEFLLKLNSQNVQLLHEQLLTIPHMEF